MHQITWLTVNCSYSHSSLVLPLLHGACKDIQDWHWTRMEIIREDDSARVAADIAATDCDLLCATLYLFNREKVMDILRRIHVLLPDLHIAVGGPECPAGDAEKILADNPFISSVFSGEGEGVFPDFLKKFDKEKTLRRVINGHFFQNWENASPPCEDPFFRTDKPFVQIETSRGCPMDCSYCTSSGVNQRYRSLDRVRKELESLHIKGIREVRILDRTFNLPQERGAALLRLFSSFPDMHFHMEIHPQFMDDELRESFSSAQAGTLHVEAGIQSLNPDVQKAIGRRSEVEKALDGLRFLTSCRTFDTHTDLLAGLPAQTMKSLKQDIITLMQIHPAEIQLEILKILPGTPILKDVKRYQIVYSPAPPYDVMRTSTMTPQEILEARHLSRLMDLFYNHKALHPVLIFAVSEEKDFFLQIAAQAEGMDLNTLTDLKKRFLFLHKMNLSAAIREELALQWLLTGYPVSEGPACLTKPIHKLPDSAGYLSGDQKSAEHRETRFYSLDHHGKHLYFAFNRNFQFNKPCGIWQE